MSEFREFRYLIQKEKRPDALVLEKNIRFNDIKKGLVVKDEHKGRYIFFPSRAKFWDFLASTDREERCFHEVIFGNLPQKIKFDIDMRESDLDRLPLDNLKDDDLENIDLDGEFTGGVDPREASAPPVWHSCCSNREKADKIVGEIIDTVCDIFYHLYFKRCGSLITRKDIIVTESSGMKSSGVVFSFHLIVNSFALGSNDDAKKFTSLVRKSFDDTVRAFIDPQVNKKIQNFRILGCHKRDTFVREKVIVDRFGTADVPPDETLVGAVENLPLLPSIAENKIEDGERVFDGEAKLIVKYLRKSGVTNGHVFRNLRGSILSFDRLFPTHCQICGEVHHKDNSLMVLADRDGEKVRLVELCRQNPGSSRFIEELEMGEKLEAPGDDNDEPVSSLQRYVNRIKEGDIDPHRSTRTEFEKLKGSLVYSSPRMKKFSHSPTLVVKAQMGLGKTKELRQYMDEYFPETELSKPIIRFITFRRTFSKSIKQKFPDFSLYTDLQGRIAHGEHKRLIVQVESLHRIVLEQGCETPDLLILDEAEAVLSQFSSGLHKNPTASFAMFQWLVTFSKHVVCLDANVGDRTYTMLRELRGDQPISFHWNKFKLAKDDNFVFTSNKDAWLQELLNHLELNEKIVVPTNSLSDAEALLKIISERFPGKKVQLYSSKTDQNVKTDHFGNVNAVWKNLDVLIYTPTVSAGVSFEIKHFDCLFGTFNHGSCPVETCRQMLGRVRSLRSRNYYIHLFGVTNNLPETTEDVKKILHDRQMMLHMGVKNMDVAFTYDANGEIEYYASPFFSLWLETIVLTNLSKNRFTHRFIDQVADAGSRISVLDVGNAERGVMKKAKMDVKEKMYGSISGAREISDEVALSLTERQSTETISESDFLSLKKYQLRQTYSWFNKELSAGFVRDYFPPGTRRVYKNLTRITQGSTVNDALERIRMVEKVTREANAGGDKSSSDAESLYSRHVYHQHAYAITLLRVCGFRCILDRKSVYEKQLTSRLRCNRKLISFISKSVGQTFGIRSVSPEAIHAISFDKLRKELLKMVNGVVRQMYGLEIRRVRHGKNGENEYSLGWNKTGNLFSIVARKDETEGAGDKPVIVSGLVSVNTGNDVADFIERNYLVDPGPLDLGDEFPVQ